MSYQSDFQKVVEFNTQFDVSLHKSPQLDIFLNEPKNVEFCLKLIREEVKELQEALINNDYIEVIDALADIIYVVDGMGARIGCNMDYAFNIVFLMMLEKYISHEVAVSALQLTPLIMLNGWDVEKFNYSSNDLSDETTLTNFQKIVKYTPEYKQIKNGSFDEVEVGPLYQTRELSEHLIASLGKLEAEVINKDYIKTIKYLGYILYDSYKMSAMLGTDMDKAFDLVHKNNMSKLCATEEDAKDTVTWYLSQVEKLGYESPSYRLAPDNKHWVVFNKSTAKILKANKWEQVDLKTLYQL